MPITEFSRRAAEPPGDDGPPLMDSVSVLRAAARPGVTFFLTVEDISRLTTRQWEILGLLSTGVSQREISEELWIGASTMSTHRRAILKAFGVTSCRQAVSKARRMGLLA